MNTVNAVPNLRRLFLLRNIVIAGQVIAIAAAVTLLGAPLALAPMSAVIAVLVVLNLRTWTRLRRDAPVGDAELFFELLADVACLTALLYLSGGSTNPFVSLYLLPLPHCRRGMPGPWPA